MANSLTGNPRGGYEQLAHFGEAGAFPADGETPQKLYKGDGTESPISMTATKLFVNGVEVPVALNNYVATAAPTLDDDASEGYALGSLWYDTVGLEAYRCLSAAEGAADWQKTTLDGAEVAALFAAHSADTDPHGDRAYTDDQNSAANAGSRIAAAAEHTPLISTDRIPVSATAASGVLRWFSLATLWTYLKATYLDVSLTLAGAKTFSGASSYTSTARPTSAGTGLPASIDLCTRNDVNNEIIWGVMTTHPLPPTTYANSGSGSTAAQGASGARVTSGTVANSYGQVNFSPLATGIAHNSAYKFQYSIFGNFYIFDTTSTSRQAIRFILGPSGVPTMADQNPLSASGIGWEIYFETTQKIRAFAHNGSTFTYGTGVTIPANSGTLQHIIIEYVGGGSSTVNLYVGTVSNDGTLTRTTSTPFATCTGAATSGNMGAVAVTLNAVGHTTLTATAGAQTVTVSASVRVN